jgi:cytochrome c oxidase subunit II
MVVLMRSLMLALLFILPAAAMLARPAVAVVGAAWQAGPPKVQIVEITAERFSFSPSQIRTKAGTTLEIRLRSDDTAHGFHIVGTDVDIELPKRGKGVATVMFTPQAGRYTFECSNLCGAGHEFMRGVIVASE